MSINTAHEIKELQSRIAKQEAMEATARDEMNQAVKRHSDVCGALNHLRQRLRELTTKAPAPAVTEHALLRYIERLYGIDLDKIRADILTPPIIAKINALKSAKIEIGPGVRIVVKDRVVVTVET